MTYITPNQVKIVQIARRKVEKISNGVFDEAAYQIALRSCWVKPDADDRCSSKFLTQAGFEKYMSIMEGMGYRAGENDHHWRDRNSRRTGLATSRQVYEIRRLSRDQKYPLSSLCLRVSNNTHTEPEKLTFKQAHGLIEALKSIDSRSKELA